MAKLLPSEIATNRQSEGYHNRALDDEHIKAVWAYHFPRRRENVASKAALIQLLRLVSERATTCAEPESTADIAERFGIPRAEFFEFEQER